MNSGPDRLRLKSASSGVPDQCGRTIVVTGASGGIGEAAARSLARAGARVILAVRDLEKGRRIAATMTGKVEVRRLDLSHLSSVRDFAESLGTGIDVLVNNAGVMGAPFGKTADGFETHLGVNHLGPFALTGLLLPRIRDRVVIVSSHAHRYGRVRLDDLHFERGRYGASEAYAQSKLANLQFGFELHRRLSAAGSMLRVVAAHPGLARSNLLTNSQATWRLRITRLVQSCLGQSAECGALPLLGAATADIASGSYIGPGGWGELRGRPKIVESSAAARDSEAAGKLWAISEALTGVRYGFEMLTGGRR